MSLLTIVHGGLAGRVALRRVARPQVHQARATEAAVEVTGGSMRVLEAGMAFIAIATAILINGR